jgi:hypothetical protein
MWARGVNMKDVSTNTSISLLKIADPRLIVFVDLERSLQNSRSGI